MFGIGMPELMVILVIALLVVGPKRLPDLAKTVGKGLSEFRKATEGATDTLKESLRVDELKQDMEDIKESFLSDKSSDNARPSPPKVDEGKKAGVLSHDDAAKDSPKP